VIEGRIEICGRVVSTKWVENNFSYHGGSVLKIVVRDNRGFKVWGTCPSAIASDVEKGTKVTFTATVTKSDKDEDFGFFKRPTCKKVAA